MFQDAAEVLPILTRRLRLALVTNGAPDLQNFKIDASGQEVPHFHVHVVPRYENDGGARPDRGPAIPCEDRAEVAARVQRYL